MPNFCLLAVRRWVFIKSQSGKHWKSELKSQIRQNLYSGKNFLCNSAKYWVFFNSVQIAVKSGLVNRFVT
jgi:hypothetical protein